MEESLFPNEPQLKKYCRAWTAAGYISPNLILTHFTAKALYAFGMMRHLMESAGWTLRHKPPHECFYIAAYLLSCGAIELLGRCISGDAAENSGATRRLKCGLKEIALIPQDSHHRGQVVLVTRHKEYTVDDCVGLRNFCAHGGSVGKVSIDVYLVAEVLKKVSQAMDRHWGCLMDPLDDNARNNLAKAAIAPLFSGLGREAILVHDVYNHVKKGIAIGEGLMYLGA